jgi:hypothetical protein
MYGNKFRGVRIRISSDAPFDRPYEIRPKDIPFGEITHGPYRSSIESHELLNDRYMFPPGDIFNRTCVEVIYTHDREKLVPKVIIWGNGTFGPDDFGFWQADGPTLLLSEIGKYKSLIWQSQSEWRFMVPVFPMTGEIFTKMRNKQTCVEGSKLIFDAMAREQDPGIEYIDIPIKGDHINNMQITLGPCATTADRVIVEALRDSYAPQATIEESALAGEIRL